MVRNLFIAIAVVGIVGGIAVVATPSASALTVSDIQAQIQELKARISTMVGTGYVQSQNAIAIDPVNPAGNLRHRICNALYRNLSQGTRGDDVVSLQEYLRAEGYLSANATGYFGPLTHAAVARWQASQGVSAVGAVGPMSRERIRIWCGGGGWTNQERFSATPARGEAPLSVTLSTWLSGFRPQSIYYTIDFGDGESERAADCPAPADACTGPGQNKHTYRSNGTYTATLNKITDPCGGNPMCMAPMQTEVVGKAQIYVGPQNCTKEYKPVCGQLPEPACRYSTPACMMPTPGPQTYSNRCMMNADGATFLYEGVCRGDAGNKPPVISGFSGPTTLNIDQTGTWSVSASDPENGQLSYRVSWGDEQTMAPMASYAAREAFVQTTTFTHAYNTFGTYTITVVVRDSAGLEARTTTSVQVAGAVSYCTADAMQCPDGTWVGRSGPNCQFVCPTTASCAYGNNPVCGMPRSCQSGGAACAVSVHGKTFSNRCLLEADGGYDLIKADTCESIYQRPN